MDNDNLVMSVEAAAKALHISRNLAYQATRSGQLPCIRIGRRLLVPRRALEKLLEGPNSLQARGSGVREKRAESLPALDEGYQNDERR